MNVNTTIFGYVNPDSGIELCPRHAHESGADKDSKHYEPVRWYDLKHYDIVCDVCTDIYRIDKVKYLIENPESEESNE
jgi:hypothetical protein